MDLWVYVLFHGTLLVGVFSTEEGAWGHAPSGAEPGYSVTPTLLDRRASPR